MNSEQGWTSIDAKALVRLQIELEYELDSEGLLVPIPGSTERARFVIHHHAEGFSRFYRHDVPVAVRARLASVPGAVAIGRPAIVRAILAPDGPPAGLFLGTSAFFPRPPAASASPDVSRAGADFVILVDDKKVSMAWSVRESEEAAELGVETAESYRARGYGRQVASAWARHVMTRGKIAFYSYADGNHASRALARSLGVVEFSRVAAYE